jgi:hypothetical protein
MSLDYNLTEVNRSEWPDGGVDLYNFCVMMLLCGVGSLKKQKDLDNLHFRAFALDKIREFGWERCGLIDLIPKMKGISTNCTDYNDGKFQKKLIETAKMAFEDERRAKVKREFAAEEEKKQEQIAEIIRLIKPELDPVE